VSRHDVTDEQREELAEVVPLHGDDFWPSWPGHRMRREERTGEGTYADHAHRRAEPWADARELPGERRAAGHGRAGRSLVVMRVRCFADARQVAEHLMGRTPVLMDLTGVEADVARRVLDFASGVVFGLSARMHRVDRSVFLLTPSGTEVAQFGEGIGKREDVLPG
jgi:FtsZ-interacting cell division protein YlmF